MDADSTSHQGTKSGGLMNRNGKSIERRKPSAPRIKKRQLPYCTGKYLRPIQPEVNQSFLPSMTPTDLKRLAKLAQPLSSAITHDIANHSATNAGKKYGDCRNHKSRGSATMERSNAPHERRGHSRLSLALYGARRRSMRLLDAHSHDFRSFVR